MLAVKSFKNYSGMSSYLVLLRNYLEVPIYCLTINQTYNKIAQNWYALHETGRDERNELLSNPVDMAQSGIKSIHNEYIYGFLLYTMSADKRLN